MNGGTLQQASPHRQRERGLLKGQEPRVDGEQGGGEPSVGCIRRRRPCSQAPVMLKGTTFWYGGLGCSHQTANHCEPSELAQRDSQAFPEATGSCITHGWRGAACSWSLGHVEAVSQRMPICTNTIALKMLLPPVAQEPSWNQV